MDVRKFVEITGADFFTGVPDSQLRALCDYLMDVYGSDPKHHLIAANEGNCAAVAAGFHLATGRIPVVYMQNSGFGNLMNPLVSLLNKKVYGIPCMFIIGWRGEPGVPDEPQHVYQGEITLKLLEDTGTEYFVLDQDTKETALKEKMQTYSGLLAQGRSVAFVVRKGALAYDRKVSYMNAYGMRREAVIRRIVRASGGDPVLSTTGKASRELYEIRERNGEDHQYDFLTVGSMGHASSIALGVALHRPGTKVWCIDGDGAALMHMGAMAVIGQTAPENLIHVVINNEAHESVGGMPTAAGEIDLLKIAEGCGYKRVYRAQDPETLDQTLRSAREGEGLAFLEVKAAIGAREDLGRPASSPKENKKAFMEYLSESPFGENQ